jgi:hypothetical protein
VPSGAGANCGVGPNVGGVSLQVVSRDHPIVVERPMYMVRDFGSGNVAGAHDVVGANGLGELFGFAAASTATGQADYLTLQNPGDADATVTISYYTKDGRIDKPVTVPAHSRVTVPIYVASAPGGLGTGYSPLGVVVTSNQPILVEKPTYGATSTAYGATDTVGYTPSIGF